MDEQVYMQSSSYIYIFLFKTQTCTNLDSDSYSVLPSCLLAQLVFLTQIFWQKPSSWPSLPHLLFIPLSPSSPFYPSLSLISFLSLSLPHLLFIPLSPSSPFYPSLSLISFLSLSLPHLLLIPLSPSSPSYPSLSLISFLSLSLPHLLLIPLSPSAPCRSRCSLWPLRQKQHKRRLIKFEGSELWYNYLALCFVPLWRRSILNSFNYEI